MSIGSIQSIAVNIPELMLPIAEYLDSRDIASCMATCRALARHMEPFLWRHLTIKNKAPPRDPTLRNRSFLRTIAIHHEEGYETSFLETLIQSQESRDGTGGSLTGGDHADRPFAQLHTLTLHPFPKFLSLQQTIVRTFLSFMQQTHHTLTTLTLPAATLMQEHSVNSLVQDTLPGGISNLRHLTIGSDAVVTWSRAMQFLVRCFQHSRLISLRCGFVIPHYVQPPPFDDQLLKLLKGAVASKDKGARIKDLRLPSTKIGYDQGFIIPFLEVHGPYLQSMEVPLVLSTFIRELEEAIEQYCPSIQHFSADRKHCGPVGGAVITALIRGCKAAGFQSVRFCGFGQMEMMDALLCHHAKSLEKIEFEHCAVRSEHQRLILEQCSNLKRMWVQHKTSTGNVNVIYADECENDWECLNLRELCVTYDQSQRPGALPETTSTQLFKQIGRLSFLEYLAIGAASYRAHDLTIQRGCLMDLAGMKQLRHFHMGTDLWKEMGQEEVEFMHQSWPILQGLSFECSAEQFKDIKDAAHWMWLRQQWPWLQFRQDRIQIKSL
ncbi:hypothetical protein B0O80DRAFT_502443 [Mortierella sp. GBAus27b]|nr:hypothetical protein B0O80DRAFT_502443 [Mortierella sp. GBAus27b]